MPTLVCVPITVHDVDGALALAEAAKRGGADLVEFRIDEYFSPSHHPDRTLAQQRELLRLSALSPLPCIVTCRAASEGGGFDGDDTDRISLYERLANTVQRKAGEIGGREVLEHPPRYIDVEWSTLSRSANIRQKVRLAINHPEQLRDLKTSLILSTHDFSGRPADLLRRASAMASDESAAVVKVAFRARSLRDALEALDLPMQLGRPTIALAMGEFGLISRVLAPKFGGFLTFAALTDTSATAPGQPTLRDLLDLYHFRSIGRDTAVYGIVGWPVGHSMSPLVHNAGFAKIGYDAVYLPLPIAGDADPQTSYASFKASMLDLVHHPRLAFRGCSVTIPHKENLVRLAREQGWHIDDDARAIGAGNTLAMPGIAGPGEEVPPRPRVANTDARAVTLALARGVPDLKGKNVEILGAGGAARAAAYACAVAGARVIIHSRERAKGEALAGALGDHGPIEARDWSDAGGPETDAVVNCTPVGMAGGPDPKGSPLSPAQIARLGSNAVVMDTVYNPVETTLLAQAKARGLQVVDGVSMFVAQAQAQFTMWTGREAGEGFFEGLVRSKLGSA